MKCEDVRGLFLAYHDGDLAHDERQALEAHLNECEACVAEWTAYSRTLDEVSGMFQLSAPKDFTERVKHTIGRRSKGRFFGDDRNFSISFAVVSFILILFFLLAYLFLYADRSITLVSPGNDSTSTVNGDNRDKSAR